MAITITESGKLVVTLGRRGIPGVGVIAGGTTGQVLSKASATDYDMEWSAAGSGDMASAVYDPTSVAGDAFDMDNMAEGTTNKILTSAERTQLTSLTGAAGGTTGQIATKASDSDYDLAWSDDLTVPGLLTADHIHGNIAGTLYIHVKNTSGGTLAKGTPVYVTGHVGSSDRAEVAAADQSDPAKMPAIALLAQELANNGEGDGVIVGEIRTYDTDTPGWALNDELFVGTGSLTATKPTTGAVQPVATVGRLQASTGVLVINCQGQRSPDETFAPALGADDNYVTDAEKVVIGNTSGTNTGDQDLSGLALKSNVLELDNTDAFTPDADYEPATKKYVDDNAGSGDLLAANNLSDLANAATARTNLGLGTAATSDTGDFATAAQGSLADSALQSGDIDTLAELNAIITDATLIDTTDSRLSDSRTCDNTFDDAATARTNLGVDPAGTDNSTDVSLAAGLDYLSLSGQEITLGSVDLTTDVTGILPAANGGTGASALSSLDVASLGSGAATDGYVATADGAGGVAWEAASGGGGNWTDVSTNAVELNDGTTATYLDLYQTDDGAGNSEYGRIGWDTNEFVIGPAKTGTGTLRNLRLETNSEFLVGIDGDTDHWMGLNNTSVRIGKNASSGIRSVVIGSGTANSTRNDIVIIAENSTVSNHWGTALGNDTSVTGDMGVALGYKARATRTAEVGLPGFYSFSNSHNRGFWGGFGECTDSNPTNIRSVRDTANPFLIAPSSVVGFSGIITAKKTDASENAVFGVEGAIKRNGANATALIGVPAITQYSDNADAWTVTISADDTSETLKIELTAESGVKFAAHLSFCEIT